MNDLPIAMYGGIMTAFMALNDGVPRNMPAARKPSAVDVELLHSHMREGQEKYASRRGQVLNEPESLDVGLIVNVRATPTELAKQYALGMWTAKGIVHAVSTENATYYYIRWLTAGLGSRRTAKTGMLSTPIHCVQLRAVLKQPCGTKRMAKVFLSKDGALAVTHVRSNGDCTYVMLTGATKEDVFKTALVNIKRLPCTPYALWAEEHDAERTAAKEVAAKRNEEKATEAQTEATPNRRARKKIGKKAYANPPGQAPPSSMRPRRKFSFVGSDDPVDSIWYDKGEGQNMAKYRVLWLIL